jgi:site-specific DNA recombinase
MRAALYVRVSTDEQAKSGYSIPDQLRELRRHAQDRGYEVVEELVDDSYSGADPNRPGLLRVYELARVGAIDAAYATKRDRFFRDRLLRLLADRDLDDYGVKLVALDDTGNTLADGFRDGISEHFRQEFAEASRRGKRQKARGGETVGSGTPPYGYRFSVDRRSLEIDPATMPTARRIFEMVADGQTLCAVSRVFNEEGVPTMGGGNDGTRCL